MVVSVFYKIYKSLLQWALPFSRILGTFSIAPGLPSHLIFIYPIPVSTTNLQKGLLATHQPGKEVRGTTPFPFDDVSSRNRFDELSDNLETEEGSRRVGVEGRKRWFTHDRKEEKKVRNRHDSFQRLYKTTIGLPPKPN